MVPKISLDEDRNINAFRYSDWFFYTSNLGISSMSILDMFMYIMMHVLLTFICI